MMACLARSHPSWVCGLKLNNYVVSDGVLCHTLRGCVDWNWRTSCSLDGIWVTPFVGVWIETTTAVKEANNKTRHTLRGCVDWNNQAADAKTKDKVTPFVGVWIETIVGMYVCYLFSVTPFVGVWIETLLVVISLLMMMVTPFVGVWIETYPQAWR